MSIRDLADEIAVMMAQAIVSGENYTIEIHGCGNQYRIIRGKRIKKLERTGQITIK